MMHSRSVAERWDGPSWRWWALLAGVALVLVTTILAQLAALLFGERASAYLMIGLLAELVILSFLGSGMLGGTSRRMSRGGLQRETVDLDAVASSIDQREVDKERERQRQDRRTIRMGIMALPVFLTFIYLLFR